MQKLRDVDVYPNRYLFPQNLLELMTSATMPVSGGSMCY